MPDVNTLAEPSSAQPANVEAPQNPNSHEYANWRVTGELPEARQEEPAPSKTVNNAPAKRAGNQQQEQPHMSRAARDLQQYLQELKDAGLSRAELRTFKENYVRKTAEAAKPSEQPVKPADEAPKRPQWEDFQKFGDQALAKYQEADDKYHEALADRRVLRAIAEDRQRQANEAMRRKGAEELDAAAKRYGEESRQVIIETATAILGDNSNPPLNPVLAQLLSESPILADLMYVIGSKADDMAEFVKEAKTAPGKAIRRAVLLERLVKEELAKSVKPAKREEPEEDFEEEEAEAPPAKKVTKVGPPPREASGRAAAPPDEVSSAVAANDARRYFKEQNQRDLHRRRAG